MLKNFIRALTERKTGGEPAVWSEVITCPLSTPLPWEGAGVKNVVK